MKYTDPSGHGDPWDIFRQMAGGGSINEWARGLESKNKTLTNQFESAGTEELARNPEESSLQAEFEARNRLQENEKIGQAYILKALHVGASETELRGRLASEPKISRASTFFSPTIAESVISRTLWNNRSAIARWLANNPSATDPVLKYSGNSKIGFGVMRGSPIVNEMTNARVVLRYAGNGEYYILTAFPEI